LSFRQALAAKAFAHTASYDAAIARFLSQHPEQGAPRDWPDFFPLVLVRTGLELRYGENPHQKGAFYRDPEDPEPGIAEAELVQGKPLSYNNIADADAAYACVRDLPAAGCVIVKHMNPCGAAVGATPEEAYAKALACDPTSAFGGIVAFNAPVDRAAAERIIEIFTEIVIAPAFDEEALAVFAQRKNLRVLRLPHAEPIRTGFEMRRVCGGMLVQARDAGMPDLAAAEQVGARAPSADELRDLTLAWAVVKHARSNAIVIAKGGATVGIGAGLTSRVLAARLAVEQAGERAEGAVAASAAFCPFRDGVDVLARAGVVAIAQPGGSVRDEEVIAAAREHGIAMLLTRRRAFRH
ncbi:MAG: bifunctional phosphoribosylaminoimidazolecarboxamide formyltransferase/IMP cyclohydrolase PurH, partial [Zetaproteobacteria bacterium]